MVKFTHHERDRRWATFNFRLGGDSRRSGAELKRRQFQAAWEASWQDFRGKVFDRKEATVNILAHPTAEEQQRWIGMTPDQIKADIETYVDRKEQEQIAAWRFVAEIDSIARDLHIQSSPGLAGFRGF